MLLKSETTLSWSNLTIRVIVLILDSKPLDDIPRITAVAWRLEVLAIVACRWYVHTSRFFPSIVVMLGAPKDSRMSFWVVFPTTTFIWTWPWVIPPFFIGFTGAVEQETVEKMEEPANKAARMRGVIVAISQTFSLCGEGPSINFYQKLFSLIRKRCSQAQLCSRQEIDQKRNPNAQW